MKFKINLCPTRADTEQPVVLKHGAVITIGPEELDLEFLSAGSVIPGHAITSEYVVGDVSRTGDTIELTIRLPHGHDAPESVRFPQPIIVEQDGHVRLPGDTNED